MHVKNLNNKIDVIQYPTSKKEEGVMFYLQVK